MNIRTALLRMAIKDARENAIGNSGLLPRPRLAVAEDFSVSVLETALPEGFTLAGEKLYDTPAGSPEQVKETGSSNPFDGVTLTVAVALWPD
jgi:hypothetical protein